MANESKNRFYAKNTINGNFTDITTLFDGVAVLKLDGVNAKGKPINIFTEQYLNSQKEDFLITTVDNLGNPVVIRENVDIDITFIVMKKYATNQNNFDVLSVHDAFVAYMTNSDVWLKTAYSGNKIAHCICLKEYKPTTVKLQRGDKSYMMGTITLHTLEGIST